MINSKELMLGNYVMDKVSGEWMVVDEIGKNVGAVIINRDKYPLPDGWEMSPIPLNADSLKKAQFIDINNDGHYYRGNWKLKLMDNGKAIVSVNASQVYFGIGHGIDNVHQLQQLYLLLERKELEFELPKVDPHR